MWDPLCTKDNFYPSAERERERERDISTRGREAINGLEAMGHSHRGVARQSATSVWPSEDGHRGTSPLGAWLARAQPAEARLSEHGYWCCLLRARPPVHGPLGRGYRGADLPWRGPLWRGLPYCGLPWRGPRSMACCGMATEVLPG